MRNITALSLAALSAFLFITCTSTQRPQQFK